MIVEIAALAAVLIFGVLAYFIVRTLLVLQKSLKGIDLVATEIELKLKNLDSSFRAISNLGVIAEEKTEQVRRNFLEEQCAKTARGSDSADDLVTWLLSTLKLGIKFLTKR